MPRSTRYLTGLLAGASLSLTAHAAGDPAWSYTGPTGPSQWGALGPGHALCASGRNQSPVDLTATLEAELPALETSYSAVGRELVNNGHTLKLAYPEGNALRVDGATFALKQVHFHAPSEHTVDGRRYAMEAHLVHANAAGELTVVAVLFERGEAHDALRGVWAQMPSQAGERATLASGLDAEALLPAKRGYYRLNGSLTTPPCSEGVRWMVMKQPVTASDGQLQAFSDLMGHANNRPLQPLNARRVVE